MIASAAKAQFEIFRTDNALFKDKPTSLRKKV